MIAGAFVEDSGDRAFDRHDLAHVRTGLVPRDDLACGGCLRWRGTGVPEGEAVVSALEPQPAGAPEITVKINTRTPHVRGHGRLRMTPPGVT